MRFLVFVSLAIVAVSAVSANQPEARKVICEPKSTFKEDCNTCTCSDDGTRKLCTEIFCLPSDNVSSLLRQRRQISHNRPCVPGERFKIYCNDCTCGSDGFSVACTRMACPKEIWNEDGTLKHPQPVPTTPESVSSSANQVSSNPDQAAISPLLRQNLQISHDRPCVPGERFKIYCNDCTCGSDGFSVACTRMACPKEIWNEDGTLKNPQPVPTTPESVSSSTEQAQSDPNQISDSPLLRQRRNLIKRPCSGMIRRRTDCTKVGIPNTATLRSEPVATISEPVAKSPAQVSSNPEQLSNGPLLRERRQVTYDRPCTPGKRFKIYCNDCGCGADGFTVICTKMACAPGIWNEDGTLNNPASSNPLLRN